MGIKATDEDKNYISIHIKLGKGVTSTAAYKAKLEKICNIYGIDSNVNVCITGQCDGDKSIEERDQITGNILSQLGAKEAAELRTCIQYMPMTKKQTAICTLERKRPILIYQ